MHARLFARLALAVGLVAAAIVIRPGSAEKAEAQGVSVSIEFREALAPHGRWHRHSRWGEVWIPARVERGWRPYTRGHWVYTDDWGWYWVSDEDWGWVAYHYGRWVFDAQVGWVWVPGREWGPAWVSWRRGGAEVDPLLVGGLAGACRAGAPEGTATVAPGGPGAGACREGLGAALSHSHQPGCPPTSSRRCNPRGPSRCPTRR